MESSEGYPLLDYKKTTPRQRKTQNSTIFPGVEIEDLIDEQEEIGEEMEPKKMKKENFNFFPISYCFLVNRCHYSLVFGFSSILDR